MEFIKNNNKGQVALIVLLISAVALTLGLSASKKAVTDTKVDKNEEELKDAFNVAESSIDQYLSNGNKTYTNSDSNAIANITTQSIGSSSQITSDGMVIDGQNNLFWLVNHNADGSIGTTYFSKNKQITIKVDSTFIGSLKIDYFYKNGAVYSINRNGYNFSAITGINNYPYSASKSITINIGTEDALLLVLTPIGGNTNLILNGTAAFPVQGEEIIAVGEVGSGVKTQVKTINKYDIPDFFTESISAVNEITP